MVITSDRMTASFSSSAMFESPPALSWARCLFEVNPCWSRGLRTHEGRYGLDTYETSSVSVTLLSFIQ